MRRGMSFISLFVAIAFFSLSSDAIAQTVKVGAVVPLTGRYAALGGAGEKRL